MKSLFLYAVMALSAFQSANLGLCAEDKPAPVSADSKAPSTPAIPVIKVRGTCQNNALQPAESGCVTVISREQFGFLLKALNPSDQPLRPGARKQLAKTYAESLAVEAAARKEGIEDSPEFRAFLQWTMARSVTEFYRGILQEEYRKPSQQEIDAYYQEHALDYQEVKLSRILVPRVSASAPNQREFEKRAYAAAVAARDSLLKGSDPAQLEKDAYTSLGLGSPPLTEVGNRRRADLLAEEAAEIFSLPPGGVTSVITEPSSYVLYRVVSRETEMENQVKDDIVRAIFQQKFTNALKAILDAAPAELDEEYLEPKASAEKNEQPAPKP